MGNSPPGGRLGAPTGEGDPLDPPKFLLLLLLLLLIITISIIIITRIIICEIWSDLILAGCKLLATLWATLWFSSIVISFYYFDQLTSHNYFFGVHILGSRYVELTIIR